MHSKILSTDADFAALRNDWNRLAGDDPLASWDWHFAAWRSFGRGRKLHIGVVYCGARIVAIAPWCVGRRRLEGPTLEFIGSGRACTDYQRILIEPSLDSETAAEAVRELLRGRLPGRIDWDGIELGEPSIAVFTAALRDRGWLVEPEPIESCWVVDLPAAWEAFVAGMPRGMRRKINKAGRRAEDPDVKFHGAATREEVETIWSEFVRLHELRFTAKFDDGGGVFADPQFERFLHEAVCNLAERGQAKLVWCEVLGRAVSIQLYLVGKRAAAMYQSGFDPSYSHLEPGFLLYSQVFRDLIADGFQKFDFLRGNESYKADWNARAVPLSRLIAVAPGILPRLRHRLWQTARQLKRAADQGYRKQPQTAVLPKPDRTESAPADEPRGVKRLVGAKDEERQGVAGVETKRAPGSVRV